MAAQDGHLLQQLRHRRLVLGPELLGQEPQVGLGDVDRDVAEKRLHVADVGATEEQVDREAVAQQVREHATLAAEDAAGVALEPLAEGGGSQAFAVSADEEVPAVGAQEGTPQGEVVAKRRHDAGQSDKQ